MDYRMRVWSLISAFATIAALLCGCATPPRGAAASNGPTGTCTVCRYNNDLACVEFRMKDSTPKVEYHGRTYCFCSKSCEAAFVKNPGKYARAVSAGSSTSAH
jgi:YHS domain-containing protein